MLILRQKTVIFLLYVFQCLILFGNENNQNNAPTLYFDKDDYIFDKLEAGKNEKISLFILNKSDKLIQPYQIRTSCGCLKIMMDKLPSTLNPGRNEIVIDVNPINPEKGLQKHIVYLSTDTGICAKTIVWLRSKYPFGWYHQNNNFLFVGRSHVFTEIAPQTINLAFTSEDESVSLQPFYDPYYLNIATKQINVTQNGTTMWEVYVSPTIHWTTGKQRHEIKFITKSGKNDQEYELLFTVLGEIIPSIVHGIMPRYGKLNIPVPASNIDGIFDSSGSLRYQVLFSDAESSVLLLLEQVMNPAFVIVQLNENNKLGINYIRLDRCESSPVLTTLAAILDNKDNKAEQKYFLNTPFEVVSILPSDNSTGMSIQLHGNFVFSVNGIGFISIILKDDKNTWELTYWLSGEHVSYLGEKYFFDKVK